MMDAICFGVLVLAAVPIVWLGVLFAITPDRGEG